MNVSAMRAMAETDDLPVEAAAARLSTDYLNRYGEALMLLELAPADPHVAEDLKAWRPIGYRAHFEASHLRCREQAVAAYEALSAERRSAFDVLCGAMDNLVLTAAGLVAQQPGSDDTRVFIDGACETLRLQIGRATSFINANGRVDLATVIGTGLQDEIDAMFEA